MKVEKDYIDDNGKIFDIYYDEGDESPRKMYDNGATIVILRGKYESPDEITDELEEIADEGTTLCQCISSIMAASIIRRMTSGTNGILAWLASHTRKNRAPTRRNCRR